MKKLIEFCKDCDCAVTIEYNRANDSVCFTARTCNGFSICSASGANLTMDEFTEILTAYPDKTEEAIVLDLKSGLPKPKEKEVKKHSGRYPWGSKEWEEEANE